MTNEHQRWEYLTVSGDTDLHLATLGREGWELVAVTEHGGVPTLYFKRPGLDFRERVTLDQRVRYYATLAIARDEEGTSQ
jgi:hypothetical protein